MATAASKSVLDESNPFKTLFEGYRDRLDDYHDRRERLIKNSRDVTALSKKLIFHLHRLPPNADIPEDDKLPFLAQIRTLLDVIPPEFENLDPYRYQQNVSGGLQEYIEAIATLYYMRHRKLITFEEVRASIPAAIPLSADDYCGGIFDLTGELMKFAITTLAKDRSKGTKDFWILRDLREMRVAMTAVDPGRGTRAARDWDKKSQVMRQSVEKVEAAVYGVVVRGEERPEGYVGDEPDGRMDMDD
ncbi:Translin [Ascobolus immersus RN42]|uniref:Translin n=1 Tax=Ascobolus immersus RN42 TaxID=1160509 RepID=A0A3N4I019_ASCIM|nr:Translin [Ascobolus immersus RN42]